VWDWSPDDRYLVVSSGFTGTGCLHRITAEGGNALQLTSAPQFGADAWARFSPDSRRIVFVGMREKRKSLRVIPVDGGSDRDILGPDFRPQSCDWSPVIDE
jgi:Tol biopolymer transport system component